MEVWASSELIAEMMQRLTSVKAREAGLEINGFSAGF